MLARALGFEPRSKVLETRMLPLHHARILLNTVPRNLRGHARMLLNTVPRDLRGHARILLSTVPRNLRGHARMLLNTVPRDLRGHARIKAKSYLAQGKTAFRICCKYIIICLKLKAFRFKLI